MISLAIDLHLFFIVAIFLVMIRIYLLIRSKREFRELSLSYDSWTLYYRALLGALLFSGLVVMAVSHFDVGWQVWMMVVLGIGMLVYTIKEYMYYKPTSIKNLQANEAFIDFTKKKYLIELVILAFVSALSYFIR
jgi:ABC-type xylose transport system permease subunit